MLVGLLVGLLFVPLLEVILELCTSERPGQRLGGEGETWMTKEVRLEKSR